MGIEHFLRHRVSIVQRLTTSTDVDGQPVVEDAIVATDVAASIQPKAVAEIATIAHGGIATSDHTVYLLPRDISAADAIRHEQAACPVATNQGADADLPDATFEIDGVPNAAGAGHHLEIDVRLIAAVARQAGS